jgi:hypothetical protein
MFQNDAVKSQPWETRLTKMNPLNGEEDVTFKFMVVLCASMQHGILLHALLNSVGLIHKNVLK